MSRASQIPNPPAETPIDRVRPPVVSFIIPAYNGSRTIDEALRSVFAQTVQDFEVILVNDGSPDTAELRKVLGPYRDRIVYVEQENRGAGAARNVAIRLARTELIALLDADDVLEPDYLAVQLGMFREHPEIDVVFPNAVVFGDGPDVGRTLMETNRTDGPVSFASLVTARVVVTLHVTARRAAIARAGWFDESLRVCEDFDLWLRIAKSGGRIAYHRRVLVRYRRSAKSLSADPVRMCQGALDVLRKAERTLPLEPAEKEALEEGCRMLHAHLRYEEAKRSFLAGEWSVAGVALREANAYFGYPKLAFVILALSVAPGTLLRLYRFRERMRRRPAPAESSD